MTTTQQLAAKLASQGMTAEEMIGFIYGVTTYAALAEITEAVTKAIAAA
jgi:hypothetical protein